MITGGTGFLGWHLVNELIDNKYTLKLLIRQPNKKRQFNPKDKLSFFEGDLTNKASLSGLLEDIDVVFHNASAVGEWGSYRYFKQNNIIGTKNLLETILNSSVKKIIYTSTADFYSNKENPITESTPFKPRGNYHKSKIAVEQLLDDFAKSYGLKIIKIRPPGILGAGNNYMAERIINGINQREVIVIGSGDQIQSYVDARDVARCLRLASENDKAIGQVFNVTSSQASVKEYWLTAAEILDKAITFKSFPYKIAYLFGGLSEIIGKITFRKTTPKATRFRVSYFGEEHIIDDNKVRKILNYKPQYSFKQSMTDMLKSYLSSTVK